MTRDKVILYVVGGMAFVVAITNAFAFQYIWGGFGYSLSSFNPLRITLVLLWLMFVVLTIVFARRVETRSWWVFFSAPICFGWIIEDYVIHALWS